MGLSQRVLPTQVVRRAADLRGVFGLFAVKGTLRSKKGVFIPSAVGTDLPEVPDVRPSTRGPQLRLLVSCDGLHLPSARNLSVVELVSLRGGVRLLAQF